MALRQREVFAKRIPLYRKDPCLFFKEVTGFKPDPWQKEAATAIAQHRKVSIRSGQGVGKTAFEANLVLWFLSCFPYPRVVCTAPTRQQLNDVLWAEIAKWQERSPVLQAMLVWTKTRVYMRGHEKRWFAVARTATKPENMQGFHEDNMLFVVDEASGVADPIMEAIQGTLSGDNNRLLMCGNPTQNTGTFHDSHTVDAQSYYCMKVSSRDSPRTNKQNIADLERKLTESSRRMRTMSLFRWHSPQRLSILNLWNIVLQPGSPSGVTLPALATMIRPLHRTLMEISKSWSHAMVKTCTLRQTISLRYIKPCVQRIRSTAVLFMRSLMIPALVEA